MIQPETQLSSYWQQFTLESSDIEQLYNHFLENQLPQTTEQLSELIIRHRVANDIQSIRRRMSGKTLYQPKETFAVGDELVFPSLNFATGTVTDIRKGHNPKENAFNVITVEAEDRTHTFATELDNYHAANLGDGGIEQLISMIDSDSIVQQNLSDVSDTVLATLQENEDFLYLGGKWFVQSLLVEIGIGHLHLAEAVLDMQSGGPAATNAILPHLDLGKDTTDEVQAFSLNYAMLNDDRFDEIAPKGQVAWFLRRMEPEPVREVPARLQYKPQPYDEALLTLDLLQLERELSDEWSDYTQSVAPASHTFALLYPHRLLGTLPLSIQLRSILPLGRSPRQQFTFKDADNEQPISVWVVKEGRYLYGLSEWYEENSIPVGGTITIRGTDEPNTFTIDCHRRARPRREDVRLASVDDNQLRFELSRRRIACDYDALMLLGTDITAAIDALWNRFATQGRSLSAIVAMVMGELSRLSLQESVHVKTIYSAVNMIYRVPPAPLFAELVRHPAFKAVTGDYQYWMFDKSRWQGG